MPDFKPNGCEFSSNLMIPEAQHLDALFLKEAVSIAILGAFIREAVSATVDLDRQPCDGAVEIQEVYPARILATELEFIETAVAEQAPESFFGFGGALAEPAREAAGGRTTGPAGAILR